MEEVSLPSSNEEGASAPTPTNNNEDRETITTNNEGRSSSSSSSPWEEEMESTAGVASDGDLENDQENIYSLAMPTELSTCWKSFETSINNASFDDDDDAEDDEDENDTTAAYMNQNDNEISGRRRKDSSESSSSEEEEQYAATKISAAQSHGEFMDPFPFLSPIPSKQSRKTLSLTSTNIAKHDDNMIQEKNNISSLKTIPQFTAGRTTQSSFLSKKQQHSNITPTSGSHTPPFIHYDPLLQSPPMSRSNTPIQPTSVDNNKTPIKVVCNNLQKLWIDPFPTPDVSVCSSTRGYNNNNTPSSSRIRNDTEDDVDDDLDLETYYGHVMGTEWSTILADVPLIPPEEELQSENIEEEEYDEHQQHQGRKNNNDKNGINKSCPRLHSLGVSDLPIRKVVSEGALFPIMMKRTLSMENIWDALQSGPDGNDLITDDYTAKEKETKKKNKEGRRQRRNSDRGLMWDCPIEYTNMEQKQPLLSPVRNNGHAFRRSQTVPIEKTSWDDGLLRRRFPPDVTQTMTNRNIASNGNNNRASSNHIIANHTITNTTGADLAKEVKTLLKNEKRDNNNNMKPARIRLSKVVATAKHLAVTPVRTVHNTYRNSSQRAAKLVRNTRQRLRERKELRRQRRLARMKEPPRSWWIVIPADHPYKIAWDVLTMLWALLGAYRTHVRIRDREFAQSPLIVLTEVWFTLDILLNFVTEHKTRKGEVIRDGKTIWARYLTTWFIIDILSLIPWERIYVQPVVQKIKRRNFFQKSWFRSKAVVRVSRVLRGRHIKLFGKVSKQTGTPLRRLVALVIKYLPKYLVFLRNMKGALVVRALRFIHWLHNMYKKIWVKARNARRSLAAKHRMGHPLFSPLRRPDETQHDTDSDPDDTEEDELDDVHSVSSHVESENDDSSLMMDDYIEPSFHRVHNEGSPVPTLRRRCYSQNQLGLRS